MEDVPAPTDNKAIANIFFETADLMEIAGEDGFRIRSYRPAGETIEAHDQQLADIYNDENTLLAIPGIGKSIAGHIRDVITTGKLPLHQELLNKFHPSILELPKS